MASEQAKPVWNVTLVGDTLLSIRNDLTERQWMDGVNETLHFLWVPPCKTSQTILNMVMGSRRQITIVPFPKKRENKDKSDVNASAKPTDPAAATRPGGRTMREEADGKPGTGTGNGSDVVIEFTAQDSAPPSQGAPLNVADEAILHEMVHAMRETWGMEDSVELHAPDWAGDPLRRGDLTKEQEKALEPLVNDWTWDTMTSSVPKPYPIPPKGKFTQRYHEYEEFIAVLLTNIYRSENKRAGLMRDHTGFFELPYPLTVAKTFLTVWRPWIERLCNELPAMVSDLLAGVDACFNPIFELYLANGWPVSRT